MSIRKATLFAGSMLFTLAAAGYAAAQTNNPQNPTVIVTGSRIPKPNLDQPVPVEVVTQQIIQNAATPDLGQVIATLPSMGVQGTMRANVQQLRQCRRPELRRPAQPRRSRTLTLVDGQRHVAADPGSFAVDLGSIPPALVDRVEVVTGGASAIYGSDAIAGVVNIILKKQFVGVQAEEQGGWFPDGDYGPGESGYLTVGRNFASDRGNVNVTLFWDNNAQILANQVPGCTTIGAITQPVRRAPSRRTASPRFIVAPNVESEFINNTGVLTDLGSFTGVPETFTANGTPIPQQQRINSNSFAFGQFEPDCHTCFRIEDYELIKVKTDRIGGDIRLSYDITPHLNFNIDEKLLQREIYDFNQPSISFFSFIPPPDNAFITPAIANADRG